MRETNHVEPPREPAAGYHLDADLADNAIAYLRDLRISYPRRRRYARTMEVCAGFIEHADHQIGRVLDDLARTGDLDNTIVVFVSDNGAAGEGGPNGTYNQLGHYISDEPDAIADELAHIDDLGGFRSSGHYPWGWAPAGNTPFRLPLLSTRSSRTGK